MKKLLIVLLAIAVICTGAYFYFHKRHQPVVNDEIAKRLSQLVKDGSNGLYTLQIDSLEANVVDSKLTLFKAHLVPDTLLYQQMVEAHTAPADLFDVSIDQFSLDDISPVDFLTAKEVNLKKILIQNPVINVRHQKQAFKPVDPDSAKTVFQRIQDKISRIKIDTIYVENASCTYVNITTRKTSNLKEVDFLASNLLLDESTQNDSGRFMFAQNVRIHVANYQLLTSDSLYRAKFGDIYVGTALKHIEVKNLSFTPRVPAKTFYERIKHQQDYFNLKVNQVNMENIDWWTILGEEALTVHRVNLDGVNLEIFNDKSMPPDKRSKLYKYPHQLLMSLSYGVKVDTMGIRNMALSYTELNPKSGEKGTLAFTDIDGTVLNITNDSASVRRNSTMSIDASARFMRESPLKAVFKFNLKSHRDGNFELNARLGKVSAEALNRLTIPLGLVKIDRLNLRALEANIKGNNFKAGGTVKLEYDDLKISVLKDKEDTVKKRKLLSFIANSFVLKSSNPQNGKPVRISQASYKRDLNKSFFNLVWKTIFTGAKETVGYK